MKKVMKRNDMAIYWLENQNPFFLKCPWQGVHFTEIRAELNQLTKYLLKTKRYNDLERAAKDIEYQKKLLKEFGIE